MSRRNKTSDSKQGGKQGRIQQNNYQDKFSKAEFNKGFRAGEKDSRKGKRFGSGVYPIVTGSSSNDRYWYSVNSQIDRDSGSATWPIFTGRPIQVHYDRQFYTTSVTSKPEPVQGIMVFDIFHMPGNAAFSNDAINQAAEALYVYITQSTGRTPQYDAPDIMIYFYAVASLYATYAYATKIIGTAQDVSLQDAYRPSGLLYAMQINQNDLISNLANYRTQLNYIAINIAQIPMPQGMNFMTKMAHEMESIYMDANNAKGQLYLFKPSGYWQLVEADETHPTTYLQYNALANLSNNPAEMYFSDILGALTNMLSAIKQSEDFRIMAADVLKAFNSTISINPISETYRVQPVYDEAVLAQIENAYIYDINMTKEVAALQTITQTTGINNNYLVANYKLYWDLLSSWIYVDTPSSMLSGNISDALNHREFIFNVHTDKFKDPLEVIHLTRYSGTGFSGMIKPDDATVYFTGVNNEAWDIIAKAAIVTMDETGNFSKLNYGSIIPVVSVYTTTTESALNRAGAISQFDWHPAFRYLSFGYLGTKANPIPPANLTATIQDLDIWTTIEPDQMTRINTTAKLAAFIPRNLGVVSPF